MKRLVVLLLLSGCTPYWQTDLSGYRVAHIYVVPAADWQARCGRADVVACAVRFREDNKTIIYIQPGLSDADWACTLAEEARHAGGQNHDDRPRWRNNCGGD